MWYINFDKDFWVYEYDIQEEWEDAIDKLHNELPCEIVIEGNVCTVY